MPLSTAQKQKLHDLQLNRGGVAFVQHRSKATPNPTIILSLGGLGGKTINMLKGKFLEEIGECDHIYFRMLDTDKNDTDKLSRTMSNGEINPLEGAYMEANEAITLYNPAIHKILLEENIPQNMADWLNPNLKGTLLDNKGAQQKRQIGRAMLVNDVVYSDVRDKLESVINKAVTQANAINETIDVIIIAGVSGGTGSGTIIDVSYMIHDIFNSYGFDNYHIAGYVYTPDAQFEEQGIKGNNSIVLNLKRNGYAALKEIDYFMNLEESNGNYRLQLTTSEINCSKNIFSSCTLVSGYSQTGGINDLSKTIGRLTDQLMDMLTNITFIDSTGVPVQLSKSLLSNQNAMLGAWFNQHPSRKLYHRYATYKYQVLGYTSIMIPRDEILAYCVNKIYEGVITEFKNYHNLTKEMMDNIFSTCHINDRNVILQYAKTSNPQNVIENFNTLPDQITKKQIKNDPFIAYNLACELAEDEASKCLAPNFKANLEVNLYESLKSQVERICDSFGPFMAIEAITHKKSKKDGFHDDKPFSGIIEQLYNLSDEFDLGAQRAMNQYRNGGARKIQELAQGASSGIFVDHGAMDEYIARSCQLACITKINATLFPIIAEILRDVASQMNNYNNQIFAVYTSILDEIGRILNEDGQYLTKGIRTQHDGVNYYSLDILASGEDKKERLANYLDDFISDVDVRELADNFIKKMRNNRDKWINARNVEEFDVVNEVRELIDECLEHNNLKNDIIEKFITVAYCPKQLSPDDLNEIWNDDSPDGLKMQALTLAANEIYNLLKTGSRTLAQSASIQFKDFANTVYVGTLDDAPKLSKILSDLVENDGNQPAKSTAKNKFIMTTQYMSLPMYILKGMDDYNEVYVNNDTNGKHMDENKQNWANFPNPYTIDSVAKDIAAKNLHPDEIKRYPDYNILVDVKEKVDDAIDRLGSIQYEHLMSGGIRMYLLDIVHTPLDKDQFKQDLTAALKKNSDLDYIDFMEKNGYSIRRINVSTEPTDVDLARRDFNDISTDSSAALKYGEVPVPIPDMYKWIRKSMNYMNIVNKNNPLFDEVYKMVEEIKESFARAARYIDNVEIFAHALQSGMVRMKNDNPLIWNFMDGNTPVTVNMLANKKFMKTYYLYNVFVRFNELPQKRLEEYQAKSIRKIEKAEVVDYSFVSNHVDDVLSEDKLGDIFNMDVINEDATSQGVNKYYTVTDHEEDKYDAYKVLKRFYELLNNSL